MERRAPIDRALALRAKAGDREALGEVIRLMEPRIDAMSWSYSYLGRDDARQIAAMSVLESMHKWPDETYHLHVWLCSVMQSALIEYSRRKHNVVRTPRTKGRDYPKAYCMPIDDMDLIDEAHYLDGAIDKASTSSVYHRTLAVIARLPEAMQAVAMAIMHGRPPSLSIPSGTVNDCLRELRVLAGAGIV